MAGMKHIIDIDIIKQLQYLTLHDLTYIARIFSLLYIIDCLSCHHLFINIPAPKKDTKASKVT